MQMNDMIIVSVDDHAVEPPTAFLNHYPAAFRDEAPVIIDRNGQDVWKWNDTIYPTIGLNAVVGRPRNEYGMEPTRFEQVRQGCYDPLARVDQPAASDLDRAHGRVGSARSRSTPLVPSPPGRGLG